jgi:DeoD family purine-nucleoside phosphorylase
VNHTEPIHPADAPAPAEGAPAPCKVATIHLHPTAALAERVLLPGDPGRALLLAQLLLEKPLMFNHHRGLWGYTGTAADGQPLSVQSTGMGGPSAAIVLHELIALGARRAIRVGTCGALSAELGLGQLVLAREAIAADGTSAALGAGELTHADPTLADALQRQLERNHECRHHTGRIVSVDLFYDESEQRGAHEWSATGAIAVEMEASSLFAVGAAAGIQVGCLLIVTDTFDEVGTRTRIDEHTLTAAVEAMGHVAAAALA